MGNVDKLFEMGGRFSGASLDYRPKEPSWPAPWRARIVAAKNERQNYRITRHGETAEAAALAVIERLRESDHEVWHIFGGGTQDMP